MPTPTKWAICDLNWDEGKTHLYCPDKDSLEFFETNAEALAAAKNEIENGTKMVAILEIKNIFWSRAEMMPLDLEA